MIQAKKYKLYPAPGTLAEPAAHTKKKPSFFTSISNRSPQNYKIFNTVKICSSHIVNYNSESNYRVMGGQLSSNYP